MYASTDRLVVATSPWEAWAFADGPAAAPEGITYFVTDGDPEASTRAKRWRAKHPEAEASAGGG